MIVAETSGWSGCSAGEVLLQWGRDLIVAETWEGGLERGRPRRRFNGAAT